MSVRAYRVTKIEYEHPDSFNLWHDDELMGFLDKNDCLGSLNSNSWGILEIPTEVLQEAIDTVHMPEETKNSLRKDIAACLQQGYVTYYCF